MNKFCNATGVGLIPVTSLSYVESELPLLIHAQWSPLARGHLARPPGDFGKSVRSKEEMENPMFPKTAEADHQVRILSVTPLSIPANTLIDHSASSGDCGEKRVEDGYGSIGLDLRTRVEPYRRVQQHRTY